MYQNNVIGVIVRAHNEQECIASVIKSIPSYVDKVYVINDASTDRTQEIIRELSKQDSRIISVNRYKQGGPGAAAISGYEKALEDRNDIVVMMDGDGQMDAGLIHNFLDPLVLGAADYTKGNRLSNPANKAGMPVLRAFGNSLLTYFTRVASGYWQISDPQNGYTAITKKMIGEINLNSVNRGFAYENDMLIKLNVIGARVIDIPHPAVYRNRKSHIRYHKFAFNTSWILLKGFFWRIWMKSHK